MKQSTNSPARIVAILNKSVLLLIFTICCCASIVVAQEQQQDEATTPKYHVTPLSSLGGNRSIGNSINNRGWISGYSNLVGNQTRHAMLWRHGFALDLGTLGGPNSNIAWPVKNNNGTLVGISQTSTPDPLGEKWSCSAFFPTVTSTGYTCLGFVWENGKMKSLPPLLGGNNSFAAGANNRGQIVGWAENSVHDSTCVAPQILQFRAVMWETKSGNIHELPILSNDTSSAATAINNKGQIVGISGKCDQAVGRATARHAVLWEHGNVVEIGNLGNDTWNTPVAINERGDVTGFASLPGSNPDNPILHAFIWTRYGGIRDLGTLPGDTASQATGINNCGQVVGFSSGPNGNRAFIWENGVMKDLNELIPSDYNGKLEIAGDINDYGEITGRTFIPSTNEKLTFVAIPVKTRK